MRATSALDLIGNTPLISLDRIHAGPGRLVAKAEFLQPGGSVKDRAAKAILLAARADGRLKPGMPVVEMTSGNMGAGLAVACAALGHPLLVTMSAGNSPARARMLEGLGAEVILVPQVDGAPGQVTGADVQAAADMAAALARASAADSMWTSSTRSSASRRTRPARAARSWNSWADPPTAGSRRWARAAPSWAWREP